MGDIYGTERLGRLLAVSVVLCALIVVLGIITPNYNVINIIIWSFTLFLTFRNYAWYINLSWKDDYKEVFNRLVNTIKSIQSDK